MKRYIKSESEIKQLRHVGYSPQNLEKKIKLLKQDFRNLAKCETAEDLKNTKWNYWRIDRFLDRELLKHDGDHYIEEDHAEDIDDFIDSWLDSLRDMIQQCKEDYAMSADYTVSAENWINMLYNQLNDEYELVDFDTTKIIVKAPEGATHRDCINFVDHIVDLIDGKYIETGRGGSWTAWHLKSNDGVRFRAGWYNGTGSGQWFVEADVSSIDV